MIFCNDISFQLSNVDNGAVMITVVGYTVVFISLAVMVFSLTQISRIQNFIIRQKLKRQKGTEQQTSSPDVSLTGDENAAICAALYLYFTELHDEEKYVMTVNKVSKTYSPWSSKIYGIMNTIRK